MATSVVVADWSTRTADALRNGMTTPDTLWYHMPIAARFVQDGSVAGLTYVDFDNTIPFFPANSELFHGIGLMMMGSDLMSVFLNMGWLGLILLAAWCVGAPYGVPVVTLTAACALLDVPGLVATQPGGAYNDIVGIALVASSVALLLNDEHFNGRATTRGVALAALAAGLAAGTRSTLLAPVLALTVGVWLLAPRGLRIRRGGLWILCVVATGGYWYLRNLIATGNPLPGSGFHLGTLVPRGPPLGRPEASVAQFLLNDTDWRKFFIPGFRASLGPMWWAILLLVVAGIVFVTLTGRQRLQRMVALTGAFAALAFVLSPQFLTNTTFYSSARTPTNFVYNLRYSFAAVLIGLLVLPICPLMLRARSRWWLLAAFGVVITVTQLDGSIWPGHVLDGPFASPVHGADSLLGALVGLLLLLGGTAVVVARERLRITRWPSAAAVGGAGLAVVVLVLSLQPSYLRDKYTKLPANGLFSWVSAHLSDKRIAASGLETVSYPLTGRTSTNYVQAVGVRTPDGGFRPIHDCRTFKRMIDAGGYTDVVTLATGKLLNPVASWTAADPSARLIHAAHGEGALFSTTTYMVFRVRAPLDPNECGMRSHAKSDRATSR